MLFDQKIYIAIFSDLDMEQNRNHSPRRATIRNLKGLKASFLHQIQRPIINRLPSNSSSSSFHDTFKFMHFKRVAVPEQKLAILMVIIAVVFVVIN